MCVPRKPGEAMGAICRLVNESDPKDELVINVEYNQLDSLLKSKWNEKGDIANASGYSSFPGNTNTLVFKIPQYCENLQETGGVIPEFVNPKYADEARTVFKSPTRLECMMQDYPKQLKGGKDRVGYTMYDAWYCFSPAKNNVTEAQNLHKKNMPCFAMASAEYDMYNWNIRMLQNAGVQIECSDKEQVFAGVPWKFGPKIHLEPSFALTYAELEKKFKKKNVKIGAQATLLLANDALDHINDDWLFNAGTCVARRKFNFFDHVEDDLTVFVPTTDTDNEVFKIRGYKPKQIS